MKNILSPSLLAADFKKLEQEIKKTEENLSLIHIFQKRIQNRVRVRSQKWKKKVFLYRPEKDS